MSHSQAQSWSSEDKEHYVWLWVRVMSNWAPVVSCWGHEGPGLPSSTQACCRL